MGGSVTQAPQDQLAMWLAILGKSQALGGSPNPAETLRRIEEARAMQDMHRQADQLQSLPPGTSMHPRQWEL